MPNLSLAIRTLVKAPFVTAVAASSLALGIGANTAIFSMFQRVLLQPLPVPEPDRLVNLAAPGPKSGSQSCGNAGSCEVVLSYPMFRDLERGQQVLTGLAGHRNFGANIAIGGQAAQSTAGLLVSGSYFPVLELKPALGRLFGPADDESLGGHFALVLSYDYWSSRLGSDPAVLNQTMTINGQAFTIVGVAPRGFNGTTIGARPDVFVPLSMRAEVSPGFQGFENRRSYWLYAFGRLRPGVTLEVAEAGLNGIYRPVITDVEAPLQEGMPAEMLTRFRAKTLEVTPGRRGQSNVGSEAATPMILLFVVTGIVLLIAGINVANLLLARAAGRAREMAVRLSLGAGRGQLMAQLLTESVLLALVAGGLSLFVAQATLRGIVSFLPAEVALTLGFSLNGSALAFAASLSLVTGVLFGLAPALQSTRPELISVIKADGVRAGGTRGGTRFRTGMVTAQIALSMALLSSAALFLRSLLNVSRVELGVTIDHLVTFSIAPELNGYQSGRTRALFRRVEEELAAIPGVTSVTAAMVPILAGDNWNNDVAVEGFPRDNTDNNSSLNFVGVGYFETVGLPVLAGREFTAADDAGGPKVVMVNEAFAKKFKLGRDVVGKRMAMSSRAANLDIEIVGLVKDAKYSNVKRDIPAQIFLPYRQDTTLGSMNFYVRTGEASTPVVRAIPAVVAKLDGSLPVSGLKTVPEQVRETLSLDRMISVFSASFALLATLLAAVGLYGVLAYLVTQRTREIGVRMALGADGSRVRGMVLRQVGRMAVVGGVIGVAAAVGVGQAAKSLLYGLEGHDPLAIAAAALVLGLVAFAAGYLPALRASRVHPMVALRSE